MWKTLKKFIWEWRGVCISAPTVTGLVVILRLLGWLQPLELGAYDLYLRLRPLEPQDRRIAIVGITENDIRNQGAATFSDGVYAQLMTNLLGMKPRVIALDIYRDIPLAPGTEELSKIFQENPNIIGIKRVVGDQERDLIAPNPHLAYSGFNDLLLDPLDQKIRRTLLTFTNERGELSYGFGVLAALFYLDQEGIEVDPLPEYNNWWQLNYTIFRAFAQGDGGYRKVDDGGYQILLNFRGSSNHFDLVSLTDILEEKVSPNWGKDRIIFIGHVSESSGDFFFTPYSITPNQKMYGVEVHAHIASQILGVALENRPLIKTTSDLIFLVFHDYFKLNFDAKQNSFLPELLDTIWTFFWALVGAITTWRLRYQAQNRSSLSLRVIYLFLLGGILILSTFVAFIYSWWLPLVPPLFALGGASLTIIAYLARMAGDIRNTFGRYLSNEIVSTLLESPEGLKLGGERKKITILTSDLRGFTAISERLPPEEVVKIINFYLGYMAEVITKYNGTIDEFMGDGILVLFGAPIARADDAKRAIACAIEMQLAMKPVNEQMKQWGLPPLEMGIGINTGEVVVGNIGSEKRSKYGVVGSQVNLTYRIESYTIGGQIIISESTLGEANTKLKIVGQKEVAPKGVKKPITIYEIGGIEDQYQLYLPEEEENYCRLPIPIPIQYSPLKEKDIGQEVTLSQIIELSEKGGKIQLNLSTLDKIEELIHSPAPLTNLKINFLDEKKNINSEDIYAKVLEKPAQSGFFYIRFTAQPPEIKKQLGEIYQSLIKIPS